MARTSNGWSRSATTSTRNEGPWKEHLIDMPAGSDAGAAASAFSPTLPDHVGAASREAAPGAMASRGRQAEANHAPLN